MLEALEASNCWLRTLDELMPAQAAMTEAAEANEALTADNLLSDESTDFSLEMDAGESDDWDDDEWLDDNETTGMQQKSKRKSSLTYWKSSLIMMWLQLIPSMSLLMPSLIDELNNLD